MKTSLKTLLAAAGLAVMSTSAVTTAASAATTVIDRPDLTVGQNISVGRQQIRPGDGFEFTFTAAERLRVLDFVTFTGNGFNSGNDLRMATVGITGAPGDTVVNFENVVPGGSNGIAFQQLPGFRLAAGETFSIVLNNAEGAADRVDLDAAFTTAAVPVPAAGLLLLTALIGGGAAARRKKAA